MPKDNVQEKITIVNSYNENGKMLTTLTQEWLNENYFFWNLNNDTSNIKYNHINK